VTNFDHMESVRLYSVLVFGIPVFDCFCGGREDCPICHGSKLAVLNHRPRSVSCFTRQPSADLPIIIPVKIDS